jgi:hypothetical protein
MNKLYACYSHCCPVHGCKYSHEDCPVVLGTIKPAYPNNNGCEECESSPQPLREGQVMNAYMQFDRTADKSWTPAEYLVRYGMYISELTVKGVL